MRRTFCATALALLVVACSSYTEEIGRSRTGNSGGSDAGPVAPASCASFTPPAGDCTEGNPICDFDSDCNPGQLCNVAVRRCYITTADCRGTLCNFDDDCANGERCNQTASSCFRLSESQECMPCFLFDSDCGTGICNQDNSTCE